MRNTIVVKNLPIRMVLANREVSEILVKNLELDKSKADSISKIIVQKVDELLRLEGFGRNENLVDTIAEILNK